MTLTPPPVEAYEKAARRYCEMAGVDPDEVAMPQALARRWRLIAEELRDLDIRRAALYERPPVWPSSEG